MSLGSATELGLLPLEGPVPYLPEDDRPLAERWAGPAPPEPITWFHVTWQPLEAIIAREGLIPSAWTGGDCEIVFGYDERPATPCLRGDVVLEVRSRALPGQFKALWVPWWCIVGAWFGETFVAADGIRAHADRGLPAKVLADDINDPHIRRQQRLWRSSLLARHTPIITSTTRERATSL